MNAVITHSLPMLLLKGTLLLLLAMMVCRTLRRASAATRHLVWSASLVGTLLLPLMFLSLPPWDVSWSRAAPPSPAVPHALMTASQTRTLPSPSTDAPVPGQATPLSVPRPQETAAPDGATAMLPKTPPKPRANRPFPMTLVLTTASFSIWLMGLLFVFSQFAVGLRRIGQVGRHSIPLHESARQIAEAAWHLVGVKRPVRFVQATAGNSLGVPVTWGALRPVVLLPPQSASWSEDCLRAALLHELAHVQRWDWSTQVIARLACALYWWHPLVWWVARQAREESERACDDLVLRTGMKATDYAERLVEVVRSMPTGARSHSVAIAMAQPSEVEGRVQAVLARGRDRSRLSRRRITLIVAAAGVLLIPVAALRPVAHAAEVSGKAAPSQVTAPNPRRMRQGFLRFVYLKDVATDAYPKRPLKLESKWDAEGLPSYFLFDLGTGQRSRDPRAVDTEFQKLLAQGNTRRAGTLPYLIPLDLSIDVPTRKVFFTPEQRQQADDLEREKKAFQALLKNSPVIVTDADLDKAAARLNGQARPVPEVVMTFTPNGARKMRTFTASHQGELMGILVGDRLISAPRTEGEYGTQGVIQGGFRNLAEAQALADDLSQVHTPQSSSWQVTNIGTKFSLPRRITYTAARTTFVRGSATRMSGHVNIFLGPARPSSAGHAGSGFVVRRSPTSLLINNGKGQVEIPFRPDGSASYNPTARKMTFTDGAGVALTVTGTSYTFADDVRHSTTVVDANGRAKTTDGTADPAALAVPVVGSIALKTDINFKGHPIIVLDPGHGGHDAGGVSADRVTEKSLNLAIAQQLRTELERRGAVVFLTRDSDTSSTIMDRCRFAAQHHAAYLISLHCDTWPMGTATAGQRQNSVGTGTRVYYHGQDVTERRLAQSISLGISQKTATSPNLVASDTTRFLTGFGVLRGAAMPAILIECGYMNNPQELARLRDPRNQQRLSEGIASGLAALQG